MPILLGRQCDQNNLVTNQAFSARNARLSYSKCVIISADMRFIQMMLSSNDWQATAKCGRSTGNS